MYLVSLPEYPNGILVFNEKEVVKALLLDQYNKNDWFRKVHLHCAMVYPYYQPNFGRREKQMDTQSSKLQFNKWW